MWRCLLFRPSSAACSTDGTRFLLSFLLIPVIAFRVSSPPCLVRQVLWVSTLIFPPPRVLFRDFPTLIIVVGRLSYFPAHIFFPFLFFLFAQSSFAWVDVQHWLQDQLPHAKSWLTVWDHGVCATNNSSRARSMRFAVENLKNLSFAFGWFFALNKARLHAACKSKGFNFLQRTFSQ